MCRSQSLVWFSALQTYPQLFAIYDHFVSHFILVLNHFSFCTKRNLLTSSFERCPFNLRLRLLPILTQLINVAEIRYSLDHSEIVGMLRNRDQNWGLAVVENL